MEEIRLTPAQKQYIEIKKEHQDSILFFRMGDFYETFYEDAQICSKILDIALTTRDKKAENPVPMAGVPYHSADKYIAKLVQYGHKVAIAEQIGDVKPGQLVKRKVVAIITPGTFLEQKDVTKFNYMISLLFDSKYHVCFGDFSVGNYTTKSFENIEDLIKFLSKIKPVEYVIDFDFPQKLQIEEYIKNYSQALLSVDDVPRFHEDFLKTTLAVQTLNSYGKALEAGRGKACALLFNYLTKTQESKLSNIGTINYWGDENKLIFDDITIKNLEIFESSYEGSSKYSLNGVIDYTKTPMGSRLLKSILLAPSKDLDEINSRIDNIKYYYDNIDITKRVVEIIKNIGDIQRLISILLYKTNSPFLRIKLKNYLENIFSHSNKEFIFGEFIRLCFSERVFVELDEFYQKIGNTLNDEGFSLDLDYIKDGFDTKIDELRKIAYHSDELLMEYQKDITEYTGLSNLRIKYITNQGYFIEVSKKDCITLESKSVRDNPKYDFLRRQTLKIAERYTTPQLETIQYKIISSKGELEKLEKEILNSLKDELNDTTKQFNILTDFLAIIDVFSSMVLLAKEKDWCFPLVDKGFDLSIKGGKHPVIQEYLDQNQSFIPNDLLMGNNDFIHTITGPNMGGKSTFLRQNALIIFLAHCGFPVPAIEAKIGLVDGIFARIGSGDVIAKNQSTFMTEMIEVSNILHNATDRSFIVLDELGRGTSTYDGMTLAGAIITYISTSIKAKTLFATHYHELMELENKLKGVINYSVSVYETDKEVVFLKKIVKGGANKSYGIDVAKIAGLPKQIIENARLELSKIENNSKISSKTSNQPLFAPAEQSDLYKDKFNNLAAFIENIDVNNITPLQALEYLMRIKDKLK